MEFPKVNRAGEFQVDVVEAPDAPPALPPFPTIEAQREFARYLGGHGRFGEMERPDLRPTRLRDPGRGGAVRVGEMEHEAIYGPQHLTVNDTNLGPIEEQVRRTIANQGYDPNITMGQLGAQQRPGRYVQGPNPTQPFGQVNMPGLAITRQRNLDFDGDPIEMVGDPTLRHEYTQYLLNLAANPNILKDLQKWRNLCEQPRRPDRAKCYYLNAVRLSAIDGLTKENYSEREYMDEIYNLLVGEFVRRGDVILLEPFLGYRNDGKLLYDGNQIIDLGREMDEYGNIPEDFQVIEEFPPLYWIDFIEHNEYVPFNFAERLPDASVNTVREINEVLTFFFRDAKNNIYAIIEDEPSDLNSEQFLNELKEATYFNIFNTKIYTRPLPAPLNAERTLVLLPKY